MTDPKSDEKIAALIAEARKAADKIHRWAFGDDSELADRSAVRFEVERITDALEAAQQAPAGYQYRRINSFSRILHAVFEEPPAIDEGYRIERRAVGAWEAWSNDRL